MWSTSTSTRWPGLTTAGWEFGERQHYDRPAFYFDEDNEDMPEAVDFATTRPRVLDDLTDDEFQELLQSKVAECEQDVAARLRREHRRVLGESRILKQHWNRAPKGREERFGMRPRVAASSKWARVAALQRDSAWEEEYAEAYEARLRGEQPVFPYGTYAERIRSGVRVAPPPKAVAAVPEADPRGVAPP